MNEKIFFKNNEGNLLCGVLSKPKETNVCVVIAHGFTSNKDRPRYKQMATLLEEQEIACFRFDFTGSGESKHVPLNFKTHLSDLTFAVNEMKKRYENVFLIAESMAAYYAMRINDLKVDEIIFWAPKTNTLPPSLTNTPKARKEIESKGKIVIEKNDVKFTVTQQYQHSFYSITQKQLASTIKKPILIIQGTKDHLIESTKTILPLFPKGTKLELVEGAEHNYSTNQEFVEIFLTKTLEWILEKTTITPVEEK